jgi:hypothetical protein
VALRLGRPWQAALRYGSGITIIALFAYVQVRLPVPCVLYCAVNVVLPGVRPLRTDVADARCTADPARMTAFASKAAAVFAPLMAYDIRHEVAAALPVMALVTPTSTLPDAGTVTVTDGPGVVRAP